MDKTPLAAAIAAQPDPFDAVLQSLKESSASVNSVLGDIVGVGTVVTTIDDVLKALSKLPGELKIIKDVLLVLDEALLLLDPIPIIGEIAAAGETVVSFASSVCGTVQTTAGNFVKAVVDPVRIAFDDLRVGIQKAIGILRTIAQTVPEYLNTIQILSYLERVAVPLVGLLKGTDAGKRLLSLSQEFEALQREVTKILEPVAGFVKNLAAAVGAIDRVLGEAFQQVKKTAADVLSGLQYIENVFRPIRDGFNKVLHAIKPVKWALDALRWIFDKVVKPVIDKILQATGLNKAIFEPLKREVEERLGIKPIVDMVEGKLSVAGADAWQKGAGMAAATAGGEDWGKLAALLAKYNTRDSEGTGKDILLLINAITGGEIDPDAPPPPIPDWPDVPDFGGDKSRVGRLFAEGLDRNQRLDRIESGFAAMAQMQGLSMAARAPAGERLLLMDLMGAEARTSAQDMPNVAALEDKARSAAQALKQVEGAAPALMQNLQLFDQARDLPAAFDEQMEDFAALFSSSVEFADFLQQFEFVKPVVDDLVEPLRAHADLASGIKTSARQLCDAGLRVDAQIQALEAAAPRAQVFTDAFDFFDAAASGASSLAQVIDAARELDREHLDGRFGPRLDELAGQVDAAAGGLVRQLGEVEASATAAIEGAESINDYLAGYASGFTTLQGSAGIVGKEALPALTSGVHYFGLFVSILDPMSCLLKATVCKDADNRYKKEAAGYIEAFESGAKSFFEQNKALVEQAFGFVIGTQVPMAQIRRDIDAIVAFSGSGQPELDATVARVGHSLAQLAQAMQPAQSYTDEAGKRVDNVLVDQSFASAASTLFTEIQQALPPSLEPA
jgi:hypothetical protein